MQNNNQPTNSFLFSFLTISFSRSNRKNATIYACNRGNNKEIIELLIQHGAKKEDISEKYLTLWEEFQAKVSKKEIKKGKGKEEIQKEIEIYEKLGINKRISYFLAENNFPFIVNNKTPQNDEEQEENNEEKEMMDDKICTTTFNDSYSLVSSFASLLHIKITINSFS